MTLSDDRNITIHITHSTDDGMSTSRAPQHKLSGQNSQIQVHSSVPMLQLSSVQLTMRIKHPSTPARRNPCFDGADGHDSDALDLHDRAVLDHGSTDWYPVDDTPVAGHNSDMLERRQHGDSDTEEAKHEENHSGPSCGMNAVDHRHNASSQQDVFELLDAGIHHEIVANPKRRKQGIQLKASCSLKPLAELAPSIWLPGYRSAMSSRAILLPTISHALSNVGIGQARSADLKAKLTEASSASTRLLSDHRDARQPYHCSKFRPATSVRL